MTDINLEEITTDDSTYRDIQLYREYAAKCCEQNKDFETFSEFRNPTMEDEQ